MKPVMT